MSAQKLDKGVLIVLEGIDGCGKTTQSVLLRELLLSAGYEVVRARQPGGTKVGIALRELLLNPDYELNSITELLLFMADRVEVLTKVIKPALEAGKVVICDRWYVSTIAYQCYGRGLDLQFVKDLCLKLSYGIVPDIVLLLNVSLEKCLERQKALYDVDKMHQQPIDFYKRVYKGYLASYNVGVHNKVVSCKSIEDTANAIKEALITLNFKL
jgi:dTMP kinase